MKKLLKLIIPIALVLGFMGFSNTTVPKGLIDDIFTAASSLIEDTKAVDLEKDQVIINKIVDGDTINVQLPNGEDESIRLLLIDTPESVHPTKPVQKYGVEASDFAKQTLKKGQTVTLEKGSPERDKYDRILGYIWIDDINFNQFMIEEGFARVAYVYEPNTKYIDEFRKAEDQAQEKKLNIWSIPGYAENGYEQ